MLDRHPDAVLVLPGGAGAERGARCAAQIDASPRLRRQVRRLGRISEADVAGLLELADVVAVPSRYEGFGLPALEAMAAGAAVVAADATSLPEVVGDAGRLVPVGDVGAWARRSATSSPTPASARAWPRPGRRRAAALHRRRPTPRAFARLYREAAGGR